MILRKETETGGYSRGKATEVGGIRMNDTP